MGAFQIRSAAAGDAGGVSEVWLRSRRAAVEYIPAPMHTDDEVRGWMVSHLVLDWDCWVAEALDGEVVGLLVRKAGWLEQLYVAPAWQGRGVGSALLGLAKRLRPEGLQLWTFVSNTRARGFYERHGFVCVEETNGADNEEGAPDMRYVYRPDGRAQRSSRAPLVSPDRLCRRVLSRPARSPRHPAGAVP